MQRGDVYELRPPKASGRQQQGRRFGVIVQSNDLLTLSTVLIAPTSTSARPASFRPPITVGPTRTRVLVEQLFVADVQRLGTRVSHVSMEELWAIDEAVLSVVGLMA